MYITLQEANNRDADQTEWIRRLGCAFVRLQQNQAFWRRGPDGPANELTVQPGTSKGDIAISDTRGQFHQ